MVATFFFRTIIGLLFGLVCVTSAVEQNPIYQEFNNFIETTTCKYALAIPTTVFTVIKARALIKNFDV